MGEARPRIPAEMERLTRPQWEALIYDANLGIEGTEIAKMYYIDHIAQMDIAAAKKCERKSIGNRLHNSMGKIKDVYNDYGRYLKS